MASDTGVKGRVFSEEILNSMCAEYQKLLKLQDWEIIVRLVDQRDIPGREGDVRYNSVARVAYIKIPTPDTWNSGFVMQYQDMQTTLIHELIHLMFVHVTPEFEKGSAQHELWERGIDCIAKAFTKTLS